MTVQNRWAIGLATGTGLFSLTLASGLTFLAHLFVQEFSRPHIIVPGMELSWNVESTLEEPAVAQQRTILFKASDGTLLCGDFWAQPQPAPTIVLCHGYRITRAHMRSAAALEYACGYNIFCFDFRGHGDSESVMTSAGNAEVRDLEAALFVASQQPETLAGKIILHGFSMGAAVSLLIPPHPSVVAIVADSPYARSDDVMRRLVRYRLVEEWGRLVPHLVCPPSFLTLVTWWIVALSTVVFRLRFGFDVVARPDTSFRRWKMRAKHAMQRWSIPILLIHSDGDTLIPIHHARQIAAEARAQGVALETYFVESSTHCGAYDADPYTYQRVLQGFLARHLREALPDQHRLAGEQYSQNTSEKQQ
ncbi:alpha/beta hydrolase [Tengunoibacter tsumagoiensis]|uniref:Alpha/beta hydrolase n=1 Tax=Tengunoibacter tsumagoiensis TaxID=2014871 RepID=A0A402A095_9CHLR|nr:alpha/beta fold hydrolase [Tengunoibacter tsumagoiensis]GCE12577.1 alpha/beta hydrolase [Tengunoibacter tsumagoiensis]